MTAGSSEIRRVVTLQITHEQLRQILAGTNSIAAVEVNDQSVPFEEVTLRDTPVASDHMYCSLDIRVQHEDFPEVRPGEHLLAARPLMRYEGRHELWNANDMRLVQLISEMSACGTIGGEMLLVLAEAMHMSVDDVEDIVEGAKRRWENIKMEAFNEDHDVAVEPTDG